MKISYQWFKKYVPIKLSPEKFAERLTILGLEVVSTEKLADDTVFEIEVTANRPDCLNIIGIAREIATAAKQKVKIPSLIQKAKAPKGKFIAIQDKVGCPRYIGKIVQGIKVGPSPQWMQKSLKAVGMRPVNNIVDITNYLLLELGQPMHAFDLDALAEKRIIVRLAHSGEEIITIDGEKRKLDSDILVIADSEKPVGIAGIMGGKDSEVTEATRNILLESAYFNPLVIRRARRKLAILSDAAYRFERSVDPEMVEWAAQRAINLILELAGGKLVSVCDLAFGAKKVAAKTIIVNCDKVSRVLGQKVTGSSVKSILCGLGMKVSATVKGLLKVNTPSFRPDLKEEEDIIEEIARHLGFDRLPSTLPAIKISSIAEQPIQKLLPLVRETLVAAGFNEAITYSLISRESLAKIKWQGNEPTAIQNPLSKDQEIMRPTLVTGLLGALYNNLSHNTEEARLFEVGKVYSGSDEATTLGIGLMGGKSRVSLLEVKGAFELLFNKLGITNAQFVASSQPFLAGGKSFSTHLDDQEIGFLGELGSAVGNTFDFKHQRIFVGQLNLEAVLKSVRWQKTITPLINFPLIRRDISLIIENKITSGQLVELLQKEAGPLLIRISLSDQYSGEQIPAGYKGLTYCLEFQAKERTLSDEEVSAIHGKLCDLLIERLGAKIRR